MNDFFSKKRRGEDGDVVQTVLIVAIFVIIVTVMGSMIYQAIFQSKEQLATTITTETSEASANFEERNINWVTNAGKAIEEWIVAHPQEGVPATEDYVLYDDYKANVVKDSNSFPAGENTYVRVVPSENNDGTFTICGYYAESNDIELDNMDIYAFNSANGSAGNQTRGVCLL